MAIVDGADGEQLGPDTNEEREWRPVRPLPEGIDNTPVSRIERLPFPTGEHIDSQDRYGPGSVVDEDGYIECTQGFFFKTEGDVAVAENGSTQFKLSVKHKLDRDSSNGLFTVAE